MTKRAILIFLMMQTIGGLALAAEMHPQSPWPSATLATPIRMTCKSVSTCTEAVALWCGGYYGADRDNDGIPCETVCSSREEVMAIEAEIGCQL